MEFIKSLLLSLFALFLPIKAILLAVLTLVGIDLILGLIAAKKRGEEITSGGLKRTLLKLFVYDSVVIVGFIAEKFLIGDLMPVVKIISAFIGVTELKSCLENLNDISGGSLIKSLLDKLNKDNDKLG